MRDALLTFIKATIEAASGNLPTQLRTHIEIGNPSGPTIWVGYGYFNHAKVLYHEAAPNNTPGTVMEPEEAVDKFMASLPIVPS